MIGAADDSLYQAKEYSTWVETQLHVAWNYMRQEFSWDK